MATKANTGAGGVGGEPVTVASSGGDSGTAYDNVTGSGTSTLTWGTSNPPSVSVPNMKSARARTTGGAGTGRERWYFDFPTPNDFIKFRFGIRQRIDPLTGNLLAFASDTSFALVMQFQFATKSGVRHLVMVVNGSEVKDFGAIPIGSAVADNRWIDGFIERATVTTPTPNGKLYVKLIDDGGLVVGDPYERTDVNTGTAQFRRFTWGGNTDVAMDMDIWYPSISTDSPAAYQGLPTAHTAPTTTIMSRPDPLVPGTVTVTGGATASPGYTIKTLTVDIVSGPNAPLLSVSRTGMNTPNATFTATFQASSTSTYEIEAVSTDNTDAASAPKRVIINTLPSPGEDVKPSAELTTTGWVVYGGAANGVAAVTDNDDTTGRESPAAPDGTKPITHRWNAFPVGAPIVIKPRVVLGTAGGEPIKYSVGLFEPDEVTLIETKTNYSTPTSVATNEVTFNATDRTTPASRVDLVTKITPEQI